MILSNCPLRVSLSDEGRQRLRRLPSRIAGTIREFEPQIVRFARVATREAVAPPCTVYVLEYALMLDENGDPVFEDTPIGTSYGDAVLTLELIEWLRDRHYFTPQCPQAADLSDLLVFDCPQTDGQVAERAA